MSEALERVRGVRRLPLFPLPVVLFPGVPLPLHVFEERYRRMLRDIRVNGNLFGLSFFDASESEPDGLPPMGHLGCAAEVTEVQQLPDGRSNILTLGLVRYRVESYVEGSEPYLVGQVEFFEDEAEDETLLARRVEEASSLFLRIARAVRTINDARAELPELPETEPERLSFLIAAAMEIDNEVKLELLELRSTSLRLERLRGLLTRALPGYEERARMHQLSKGNGHARKKIDIE
jgi:Lon protease-like protein